MEVELGSSQQHGVPQMEINPSEVLSALTLCTCGLDPASVETGERILQAYNNHKEYLALLANIFADPRIHESTRMMASMQFKLHVDKFWRNGPLLLDEKDKKMIRSAVFTACFLQQQDSGTAKQILSAIGKMARFDFPRYWPTLIDDIGSKLIMEDHEVQCRALHLLHESISEIATKRLPADRKTFLEVSRGVFPAVLNIFRCNITVILMGPNPTNFGYAICAKKCLYAAKVLQTLMISGIRDYATFEPFIDFWTFVSDGNVIINLLTTSAALEKREGTQQEEATKVILTIRKTAQRLQRIVLTMMEEHPLALSRFLPALIGQMVTLVFGDMTFLNLPERVVVTAMNVIKIFHSERSYRPSRAEILDGPESETFSEIRAKYFGPENVAAIIEVVVTKILPLTTQDLERFELETEDYCNEIDGYDNWKFCTRPSAETLLSAFCYCNQEVGAQKIVDLIKQASMDPGMPVVVKEAIYLAAGLTAFHLYEVLDFDTLFREHLWQEFQNKDPQFTILRRRILWLVGEWCSVRLSNESRAALFKMLVDGLRSTEHFSIRLMAAKVVKATVDVFEFRPDDMRPVAPDIFHGLLLLVKECTSNDSQVIILNSLNITLERLEAQIAPFVPKLLYCLTDLWKESAESHLVQCGIVSAIKTTVKSLRRDASQIQSFACELITICTDLTNPLHVHLITDGLELWHTLLENSECCSESLRMLLRERLPQLLEITSENMELVMQIVESYMILSPEIFLKEFGDPFAQYAAAIIPEVKEEGLSIVIKLLDFAVQIFDAIAVTKFLLAIEVAVSTLPSDSSRVFSTKMGFFARCLFANLSDFTVVFGNISDKNNIGNPLQVFHEFMDLWTKKMSYISKLERRKLCGLALMKMLVQEPKLMAQHFAALCTATLDIMSELSDDLYGGAGDSGSAEIDLLSVNHEEIQMNKRMANTLMTTGTFEEIRRDELRNRNICYSIDMIQFLKQKWRELTAQAGAEFVQGLWNMLDAETKDRFWKLVN